MGKTTLLAMFYRQASSGQVPGLRMAAADARTAEYLAEKIAQIESGQPTAGSLAETELKLRLYHGPARLDLIVKDYQGEHVTLGSEEPIQEFFADCDAVLLCLDPEGSTDPAERRRRQQEVENLLERYIDRSEDATHRPAGRLALDEVRPRAGARRDAAAKGLRIPRSTLVRRFVEKLVDERYGMTRHALAAHAPDGAIFAVSSFGPGAVGNRPPAELHPMGLEGPLSWLADQLEARDRAVMTWLWDLAPRRPAPARALRRGLRAPVSAIESVVRVSRRGSRHSHRSGGGSWMVRLAACGLLVIGRRWPVTTPWATSVRPAFERERRPRRAGDRAAMVGAAGMAPVAADCSGPGSPRRRG